MPRGEQYPVVLRRRRQLPYRLVTSQYLDAPIRRAQATGIAHPTELRTAILSGETQYGGDPSLPAFDRPLSQKAHLIVFQHYTGQSTCRIRTGIDVYAV